LLTVICGSHEPHWNRAYLAQILGLAPERIRVINPPMGGSFGGRQDVYPMAAAALAAYHVRKPVKLVYSRREVMDAAPKRHPYTIRAAVGGRWETAAGRRTPRLTGLQVEIEANTGAYDSAGRYIADYAVVASVGPYRWQGVDAQARVLYSNGPKAGQFRGFGTPQAVFATECLLDELCQQLGADPLAFRQHNLLEDGDCTGTGLPVGETLGIRPVLAALTDDYREMAARVAAFNADPRRGPRRRGPGAVRDASAGGRHVVVAEVVGDDQHDVGRAVGRRAGRPGLPGHLAIGLDGVLQSADDAGDVDLEGLEGGDRAHPDDRRHGRGRNPSLASHLRTLPEIHRLDAPKYIVTISDTTFGDPSIARGTPPGGDVDEGPADPGRAVRPPARFSL
jgi:hypothetical protein